GGRSPSDHPRVVLAGPRSRPVAQALSVPRGAGAMAAPESRSVFEAAQDAALLRGLTLLTGVAAEAWGAEPAPVSHGACGSSGSLQSPSISLALRVCHLSPLVVEVSMDQDPAGSYLFPPQTEHYRLDWHRFNLKQRLLGSTASFLSFAGSVSSISGSDSESSDSSSESELPPSASDSPGTPQIPRSHRVLFRNAKGQLISAYRCVLGTGKASHSPAYWERDLREETWHLGGDICLAVPRVP
uniref:Uncharacterized protein n=1 Tax=Strigops habroptila TaxID=2489341 RepID=A0A672UI17_STRHB